MMKTVRLTRLAAVLGLLISVLGAGSFALLPSPTHHTPVAGAAIAPPDTTSNIHIGLPFDDNTTPTAMASSNPPVDYVWGTEWPGQPATTYHTLYIPYDRDEDTTYYTQAHNVAWWQANHPTWVEFKCNASTVSEATAFANPNTYVAYAFGETTNVPLDITNAAEQSYIQQTYVAPALNGTLSGSPGPAYEGIAFDNPSFEQGSWTGSRCGHYDASGNWVAQFTATADDAAYRQAIINWAQSMQSWIHTNFPSNSMAMSVNFSYDDSFPADSNALLSHIDIENDEQGFTNGNNGPPWYYADTTWLHKLQAMQSYLSVAGHGLHSLNQEPVPFASVTNAQTQWALANYLLIKNNASYFYITGYQQYGYLFTRPEYTAQIGAATDNFYAAQSVYMRDFTNGLAVVNPSSTTSHTVTLPTGVYKDLYGSAVNSITLVPTATSLATSGASGQSAVVLLCISSSNCPSQRPPACASGLLSNCSFESGLSPWFTYVNHGTATQSQDNTTSLDGNYSEKIAVTTAGGSIYDIGLVHSGLSLTASQSYRVTFWAKASTAGQQVLGRVTQSVSPWADESPEHTYTLSTSWQPYSFLYTQGAADTNAELQLNEGTPAGTYWIDNVTVTPTSNLLVNPSFESGLSPSWFYVNHGAASQTQDGTTAEDGTYSQKILVTAVGNNIYDMGLGQGSLSLTSGKTYTVSFWAKASTAGQQVLARVTQSVSPFADESTENTYTLGTAWQHYTFSYTQGTTDSSAELQLNLGTATGSYWIDNVSVS